MDGGLERPPSIHGVIVVAKSVGFPLTVYVIDQRNLVDVDAVRIETVHDGA
jgi:hypothetical protein